MRSQLSVKNHRRQAILAWQNLAVAVIMGVYTRSNLQERPISQDLTTEERRRFHSLLKLAEASEYPGERENAMAAAKRIAARKGLTLEEAAMTSPPVKPPEPVKRSPSEAELARHVHMMDHNLHMAKKRREEAMESARQRGLDAEERPQRQRNNRVRRSTARMPSEMHAWKLVTETTLPYREISNITGLDIYQIIHMKIRRLRAA
jgi:hypothetical protein